MKSLTFCCLLLCACGEDAFGPGPTIQSSEHPDAAELDDGAIAAGDSPSGDAAADARTGAESGSSEAAVLEDAGPEADPPPDAGTPDAGDDGAALLAQCIRAACLAYNSNGLACGPIAATCGGAPVDCGDCSHGADGSPLPADYACGGSGQPGVCGDACLSTAALVNDCIDSNVAATWATLQTCTGTPYTKTNGVVVWSASGKVPNGCSATTCNICSPPVPLYCCN